MHALSIYNMFSAIARLRLYARKYLYGDIEKLNFSLRSEHKLFRLDIQQQQQKQQKQTSFTNRVLPLSAELRSVLRANNRYTVTVSSLFTFNTGYLIRLHNIPFIGNAMAI